jgi:uncharacterized membrane protein YsdA (DUF1294 family)
MVIFSILLVAYILSINFYAFWFVKSVKDKETGKREIEKSEGALPIEKCNKRLVLIGVLGGALTVYICMLLFKFRRNELLLMVLMPIVSVVNIYLFFLLFRSGFSFLLFRR